MAEYKPKCSKSTQDYMVNGIKYVCDKFKRRSPGSESERNAQAYFKEDFKKFADDVQMEDFVVHPNAFMGFIPVAALFGIVAIVMYWLNMLITPSVIYPLVGTVLMLLAVAMFVFEFLLYDSFVDFLFPKKISRNVVAFRKPKGEIKRRIIFAGHADAANEWTYSYHGGIKTLAPVMGGSIFGMFVVLGGSVAMLINMLTSNTVGFSGFWMVLGIISLVFVPALIAIMFFINWKIIVDGANDNLSGAYASAAVLKEMADKNFRYENTEVCCMVTGSEEAGLRGAKAYAKRHQKELQALETVVVSLDTMREISQLQVYTKGCTGTVQDSEAVGDLIHEAGKNCGIEMPRAQLYPGAVDAEGFAVYGIRAAGFCGVNHDPKTYYHTREDTADNISAECINLSADICCEIARLYDAAGGIAKYEEKYAKKK